MSKLTEIFAWKREEVAHAKARVSYNSVRSDAEALVSQPRFLNALESSPHPVSLIAEVKRASPSAGVIRAEFDPFQIASTYREAGADCLSVLTDEKYFGGALGNLAICSDAAGLPVLRKDFLFDPYQVYEARLQGADAILLIVAGIDFGSLQELYGLARSIGLDVLIEVHDEREAERILPLEPGLVGINNRDLATFQTDLGVTERVAPLLANCHVVSESALTCLDDIERVRRAGVRSVLIGTAFCSAPDIGGKVRSVMGW